MISTSFMSSLFSDELDSKNKCCLTKGGALVRGHKALSRKLIFDCFAFAETLYTGFLQAEISYFSSLLESGKFAFTDGVH